MYVDARGEMFFDERARQSIGALVIRHGRQNKDEVVHRSCTLD
jgi:hypothetical protein